ARPTAWPGCLQAPGRRSAAALWTTRATVPLQAALPTRNSIEPQIWEVFGARFARGGRLLYVGDTENKWGYFDGPALETLGVKPDKHGKFPDVIIHIPAKNWLLLCESVTSHGPVDSKRHQELKRLFSGCKAGIVYVTAFPTRAAMAKYLPVIAWETEVWCAESPTHIIHFNGERFLGPY
ncbi:MAG: BsuBI/PstI family type II restriction endonuclease, partial [Gammaproteobacteria bacterium]